MSASPTWNFDVDNTHHDNDRNLEGAYKIAEYIVKAVSQPIPAIQVLVKQPKLWRDAGFTTVPGTHLNWPSAFNNPDNTISLAHLMYYILFLSPDNVFVSISFSWQVAIEIKKRADLGQPLSRAEQVFVSHVVPWLEEPVVNSPYVDDALFCSRYDIQFVVSIGNQQLKIVLGDECAYWIDQCVTQQWSVLQTTPFCDGLLCAITNAIIQIQPVTAEPTPRGGADYVLDNSVSFVSTDRDKTIALFLILFSEEIDFLSKWIENDTKWRELAGVPCDAIRHVLDAMAKATRVAVEPPPRFPAALE